MTKKQGSESVRHYFSGQSLLTKGAEILGRRAYERAIGELPLVTPSWENADPDVKAAFVFQANSDLRHFVLPALSEDQP